MVIAYHLILTAYGFWLPNDPRGSWSTFVRSFALYRAGGPATKTETPRSVANVKHDRAARELAKTALKYPPVTFNGEQAREVMRGIGDYVEKNRRPVHAAAVMPDHVHLLAGCCEHDVETVADQLKERATTFLNRAGINPMKPFANRRGRIPTPWARGQWVVYLNDVDDIDRVTGYIESNPVKAGHKPQRYSWIVPFTE
ncbi:MAG: transposase [Planctomycetota bacterium]